MSDRNFLRSAEKLGESANADLSHGNGVGDEASAKDCLDYYSELLNKLNGNFQTLKEELESKFPNLKQ
jgi:hypothetical protein